MNDPFGGISSPPPALRGVATMTLGRAHGARLGLQLHMPPATRSQHAGGVEVTSRLAPYAPVEVFRVDDCPSAPSTWLRGSTAADGGAALGSYFVRALPGHMVWWDLRLCEEHSHHVAAVISCQGLCALTRQPVTQPLRLSRHPQNYIATTTERAGAFWRDGFAAADGVTREFVFTEDVSRGVAAAELGEARVNAFGVALFLSLEPRVRPRRDVARRGGGLDSMSYCKGVTRGGGQSVTRDIEVAAGARVDQRIEADPTSPDFWRPEPVAYFIIYYVNTEEFAQITAGGGRPEGFKTPVGWP